MSDLAHQWGGDLEIGPTADLEVASGPTRTRQRVLRRLLTNPGDYIWQLDYGAGLARFVGATASAAHAEAIVRSQLLKEDSVSRTPDATVEVRRKAPGPLGLTVLDIRYVDATDGQTQLITAPVGG